MSPENPEEPEALVQPHPVVGATTRGAALDGHRSTTAAPSSAPLLPGPVVEALQRLVDALADEPGGGAEATPADRVPTAELDEVVRLLGDTDAAARPVLLLAHRAVALRLERDNLRIALETNRAISAAVGVLMALHHVTHDDAFDLLVRVSQHRNRKLRDVAEDVVRTGVLPVTPDGE